MRKTFFQAFFGLLSLAVGVAACGDDGPVVSTTMSGSAGAGATAGAAGTGGSAGTTAGAAGTGATGGTTGSAGTGGTGGTTSGSGGSAGMGEVYGYCTKPCGTVKDCCPAGAMDCPSNMYPNNYECKNSACRSPQCGSKADCAALDPQQDCFALSGLDTCVTPCAGDGDCTAPAKCAGKDDNGKSYCTASGGGCTDDASCNGFGKCINKVCVCTVDTDCTFNGYTKCAL